MNSTSSRSHAVFTIYLKTESSERKTRESVINLVDLAGSECVRKTGTTGDALAEGKSINESLSAFKRVLAAMSKGAKHIPFRDSLITFILRGTVCIDRVAFDFVIFKIFLRVDRFVEIGQLFDVIGLRQPIAKGLW